MGAAAPWAVPTGISAIGALSNAGGKKGGEERPKVPKEFGPILDSITQILNQSVLTAQPFQDPGALSSLLMSPDRLTAMETQRGNMLSGLGDMAMPMFGGAAGALGNVLGGGFQEIAGDTFSQLFESLQPMLGGQKEQLAADVKEQGAVSGMTRSTATGESLSRGFAGLESGLMQSVGDLTGQIAPAIMQSTMQGIGQGLGIPMQIPSMLAGPGQEAMQATMFGQQLPIQAMGAVGGGVGGMPISPGVQGKSGKESAAQSAQLGMMAYNMYNQGGGGGGGGK